MISILAFIFSIAILVFIHELGHYLAARSVGVRVEKFYIGFNFFGYALFKKEINGTEYGIGWFPMGGYVKLAGMIDESLEHYNYLVLRKQHDCPLMAASDSRKAHENLSEFV